MSRASGVRSWAQFRGQLASQGVPIAQAQAGHGEVNGAMFDRFSALHFLVGAVAGCIDTHPLVYAGVSVAWEAAEDPLKRVVPDAFPNATRDSKANALGDILVGVLGYGLGNAYRSRIRGGR